MSDKNTFNKRVIPSSRIPKSKKKNKKKIIIIISKRFKKNAIEYFISRSSVNIATY